MYEDHDEYLEDLVGDDSNLTPAMVRSVAEMQGEDEDYEGLLCELYDGLLDELADLARGSEGLSEE